MPQKISSKQLGTLLETLRGIFEAQKLLKVAINLSKKGETELGLRFLETYQHL